MPDVLWPIFRQNRHLLHDLPKLGAAVIQQWAKIKYGVCVLIMVIPYTFGERLNFNSRLHILVSAGGLQESEGRWVNSLVFDEDKDKLMGIWRFAVTTYLRAGTGGESTRVGSALLEAKNPFEEAVRTLVKHRY